MGPGAAAKTATATLLRAAEKIETLNEPDRVEAWFYRILRRTLADHFAQRATEAARVETLRSEAESGTDEQVATCACSLRGGVARDHDEQCDGTAPSRAEGAACGVATLLQHELGCIVSRLQLRQRDSRSWSRLFYALMNVAGSRSEALDRLGMVASTVCAIHCLLGVIVATSAGVWRVLGDERFELPLVVVALLVAATSIGFGFRRHRRRMPALLLSLGAALILLARTTDVGETVLSIAGAFGLIGAHVSNLRASRQCC